MRLSLSLLCCLMAAVLDAQPPEDAKPITTVRQATDCLQELGLSRQGQFWLSPEEQQLAEAKQELSKLQHEYQTQLEQVEQLRSEYQITQQKHQQVLQQVEQLEALAGSASITEVQRRRLQQQLAELQQQAKRLEGLLRPKNYRDKLQRRVKPWLRATTRLQLALLTCQRNPPQALQKSYQPFQENPQVLAALQVLAAENKPARLGPYPPHLEEDEEIAELQAEVFSNIAPAYVEEDRLYFPILVNDRQALTAYYRGDFDFSLLSASSVEQLGLTIPPEAPQQRFVLGQRTLFARQITLPSLRVGRHRFENLRCWVLPDEVFPAKVQLGSNAFPERRLQFADSHIRLESLSSSRRK